jgi:hypothetical protein
MYFFISITNIKNGSQYRVNILLCVSQTAAVFFFLTVKCETDLELIMKDCMIGKKNLKQKK